MRNRGWAREGERDPQAWEGLKGGEGYESPWVPREGGVWGGERRGPASWGGCEAVWDPCEGRGRVETLGREGGSPDGNARPSGALWFWRCASQRRRHFGASRYAHRPIFFAVPFSLGAWRDTGGWQGLRARTYTHTHTLTFFLTMTLNAFRSVCGDKSHDVETAQCLGFDSTHLSTGYATPHVYQTG